MQGCIQGFINFVSFCLILAQESKINLTKLESTAMWTLILKLGVGILPYGVSNVFHCFIPVVWYLLSITQFLHEAFFFRLLEEWSRWSSCLLGLLFWFFYFDWLSCRLCLTGVLRDFSLYNIAFICKFVFFFKKKKLKRKLLHSSFYL